MLTAKKPARRRRQSDGKDLRASRASDAVSKPAPIYKEFSVLQWKRIFQTQFRLEGRSMRPPYMLSKNQTKGYVKFLKWLKFHNPPFPTTLLP